VALRERAWTRSKRLTRITGLKSGGVLTQILGRQITAPRAIKLTRENARANHGLNSRVRSSG